MVQYVDGLGDTIGMHYSVFFIIRMHYTASQKKFLLQNAT